MSQWDIKCELMSWGSRGRSFNRDLLHSLIQCDLVDQNFALQLDPAFNAESGSRLFAEAQEAGADFAVCVSLRTSPTLTPHWQLYLESKLALDVEITDVCNWIVRLWRDSSTHHTFACVVLKVPSLSVTRDKFLTLQVFPALHPVRNFSGHR